MPGLWDVDILSPGGHYGFKVLSPGVLHFGIDLGQCGVCYSIPCAFLGLKTAFFDRFWHNGLPGQEGPFLLG